MIFSLSLKWFPLTIIQLCFRVTPLWLWTLDQSRFSLPCGFYSLLLSDDAFNDFIASATGESLSINNNSVHGNLSKLICVCRSFLFQFIRTETKIQAAERDGKAGRETETWQQRAVGPTPNPATALQPGSMRSLNWQTDWIKNAASLQNKASCFYILMTTRCILTPQTPLWLKDMMPFLKLEKTTCFSFIILVTHQPCLQISPLTWQG